MKTRQNKIKQNKTKRNEIEIETKNIKGVMTQVVHPNVQIVTYLNLL